LTEISIVGMPEIEIKLPPRKASPNKKTI